MATLYKVPTENNLQYTLDVKYTAGGTSLTLNTDVSTKVQAPGVCVVDRIDSSGNKTASKRTYYSFTAVSGAQLTGLATVDGTDQDHQVGAIVEFVPDVDTFQSYYDVITTEHNADGTHADITASSVTTAGNATIGGAAAVTGAITGASATTTGDVDSAGAVKADTVSEHTLDAGVAVDGVLLKDSQVTTDTINEQTAGAGVTVDGCLIKDGNVAQATVLTTTAKARAHPSASQVIATGTYTKIQLDAEDYDPGNNFDSTTNYRFTAPVAGYYSIHGTVSLSSISDGSRLIVSIYKNGAQVSTTLGTVGAGTDVGVHTSDIVYLASGDYLELYVYQSSGSDQDTIIDAARTYMSVHLLSV